MRFLPYVMSAFMIFPVILWIVINNFVIKGSATRFTTGDMIYSASLGVLAIVAIGLFSVWTSKFIERTYNSKR